MKHLSEHMAHGGVPDRDSNARLQAGLAATLERADRAEVQLRTATEESLRLSGRVELLEHELADAKRELAKSREETVAVTGLAAAHGARAVEMEREGIALREKAYQLGLDISSVVTERDRLASELSGTHITMDDLTAARNQLLNQLEDAAKQHARITAAAAAAEDRHKAEMQQLQVRLAASEAECRAVHHAKGTMHEDLQRARADIMALQAQSQDDSRQREEQASECRRLQRELEAATGGLAQAQRSHRSAAATSEELEEELERLRAAHRVMETELQAANGDLQQLQEETRLATERNTDLAGQLHGLSATVRHLEVENLRLADGHATLRVEIEARAAEARAARGEAAELAADRARLLAELQRKPGGGTEEDEATRLREALSASRLEVARLQRELAANDAVLADAESALVALVSEKEGLQQALSVALMSERVAVVTAEELKEELKSQVAVLAAQDAAALETAANAAAGGAEALGGNEVVQHMISYLQSLRNGGSTPHPSDSGVGPSSSTTAAAYVASANQSAASFGGAAASVQVAGQRAPVSAVPRYPAQRTLSASESGSTLPIYRPGGHSDAWEASSASGTENSGKESGSGEWIAASAPSGVPSATSLVVTSLSFAMQAPPAQGAFPPAKDPWPSALMARANAGETSMPGDGAGLAPASPAVQTAVLSLPSWAAAPAPNGSQEEGENLATVSVGGSAGITATQFTGSSNGGYYTSTATLGAAASGPIAEGEANATSSAPRSNHLPPRSPQSSAGDLHELINVPSFAPSLENEDMGHRVLGSLPTSGPQPGAATTATGYGANAKLQTPSRLPAGGSVLHGMVSAPPFDMYRTPPPASANMAPYLFQQPASAASDSPLGTGSPAGGYPALASHGPGGATGSYFSASALAGRSTFSADIASTLSSSAYRSPSRVNLVGPRAGFMGGASNTSIAEGNERGTASRPTSVGGTGAGSGSPMVSPRVMLDGRTLTRAVRSSAEALSSPLRSSSVIPGHSAVGESGAAGQQQTQHGEAVVARASVTLTSPQTSRQQQQTTPLAYRKLPSAEPDMSPSPFASGNAGAAIASPRTSGAVGVPLRSPRASGTVRMGAPAPPPAAMHSFELPSQRISKEQQQPISSPAGAIRPSVSLSFARRSTLTPEKGLASNDWFSSSLTSAEERHLQSPQMRVGDDMPEPQVREVPAGTVEVNPLRLAQAPSEEDAMLLKRLAAMDDALRAIGAI